MAAGLPARSIGNVTLRAGPNGKLTATTMAKQMYAGDVKPPILDSSLVEPRR